MDCIQSTNKAVDKFGAGKHGFNPGNPGAGTLATYMTPAWCDGVQEEILNVIRAAGLVPTGADLSQMITAINILVSVRTGGPGEVKAFARTTAPTGWLKCNGQPVSRTTYAALFAVIGTTFGAGDSATTFNLPDLRGEFVRGLDDGRGVDAGRGLGTAQASANLQHNHGITVDGVGDHDHAITVDGVGDHDHAITVDAVGNHNHSNPPFTQLLKAPYAGSLTGTDMTGSGDEQAVGSGDSGQMADAGGHAHTADAAVGGAHTHTADAAVGGAHSHTASSNNSGGTEARPRNVALLYCISY